MYTLPWKIEILHSGKKKLPSLCFPVKLAYKTLFPSIIFYYLNISFIAITTLYVSLCSMTLCSSRKLLRKAISDIG